MLTYSFGVPSIAVWTSHLLIGAFLVYIGWKLNKNEPINKNLAIVLIVLGALAILYHAHLAYYYNS
jgi:hypothetical protein